MNIGKLMAYLGIDTKDLKKAEREVQTSTNRMSNSFKTLAIVAGTTFAGVSTAKIVKDITLLAARYETLGVVMNVVGKNAGYNATQMAKFQKQLQMTGISMKNSRLGLVRLSQAQIDLTKATQLGRIAQDAAVIANINSSEAFERLVTGIQRGRLVMLHTIGINVIFEQGYKKLADQLGKTTEQLTENERMQARLNQVLAYGPKIMGAYEASMSTASKQILSMQRYTEDLKVKLGQVFTPSLTLVVFQLADAIKGVSKSLGDNKTGVQEWAIFFLKVITSIEAEMIRLSMLIDKIGGSMTFAASLVFAPGAAMGNKNSQKQMEKLASWNVEYENRYKEGEKNLERIADKELELINKIKYAKIESNEAEAEAQRLANEAAEAQKNLALVTEQRAQQMAKVAAEHQKYLEGLTDQFLPAEKEVKDFQEAFKGINELYITGKINLQQYNTALDNLYKTVKHGTTIWAEQNETIADTGLAYGAAVESYLEGNDILTKNIVDTSDLIKDKNKETVDYIKEINELLANDLGRIGENYINQILTGQINTIEDLFKGLFDSILNMFARMLSQFAANSIIEALFGSGALPKGAMTLGGAFSALTGGGGLLGAVGSGASLFGGSGALSAVGGWLGIGGGATVAPYVAGGGQLLGGVAGAGQQLTTAGLEAFYGYDAITTGAGISSSAAGGAAALSAAGLAMGGIVVAGLIAGFAKAWFKEKKPSFLEVLNDSGLGPAAFQDTMDQFAEIANPLTGGTMDAMYDAQSSILSIQQKWVDETGKQVQTFMYHFNQATQSWDMINSAVDDFNILAQLMDEEMAAATVEAQYGIQGLAEELLDITAIAGGAEAAFGVAGQGLAGLLAVARESAAGAIKFLGYAKDAVGKISGHVYQSTSSNKATIVPPSGYSSSSGSSSSSTSMSLSDYVISSRNYSPFAMAGGGIVTKSAFLEVGEGARPEGVFPLDNPNQINNIESKLDALLSSGNQSRKIYLVLEDGTKLSAYIRKEADAHIVDRNNSDVGESQRVFR